MLIAGLAVADSIDAERKPALERAKSGDLAAFEEIVAAHERMVYRVALRLVGRPADAQDIAQEVLLKLYHNLKKLRDDQHVKAWLYRVTVNACQDVLRKRPDWPELAPDYPSTAADPESQTSLEQRKRILAAALGSLGVKERAAVVLREIEGLSTEEVARILGSSEETVRSQISTARAKLRRAAERLMSAPAAGRGLQRSGKPADLAASREFVVRDSPERRRV